MLYVWFVNHELKQNGCENSMFRIIFIVKNIAIFFLLFFVILMSKKNPT